MNFKALIIGIFFFSLNISFLYTQTYKVRLVTYNEINRAGEEKIFKALVWFNEIPVIPVYTYDDPDLGRKASIKTKISTYKGNPIYSSSNFGIIGGNYGEVRVKCKRSNDEFLLQDIKELQKDNIGASLAFEVDEDSEKRTLTLTTFIFENEYPFKFPEDIVTISFNTQMLKSKCE